MYQLRDDLFRSRPKKDRVQSPASNDATNARSTSPDTAAGTKLSTSPAVEPEIVTPLPTKERTIEPSLQNIHVPDAGLAQKLSSASKADAPGSRGSRNLWAEALSKLKNDEPDIHHEFQAILEAEAAGLSTAPDKVNEGFLRSLIDEKLATIKQKVWILSFGSKKSVHVRTVIERCLGFITGSKDLLTQAGALDPVHAGLPVAALCLIVSEKLINRDKEQNKDLADALETTASIVQRYVATEQVYISHIEDPNAQFVDSITSLYTKILLLEAKLIIHLSANTGSRALKNVMGRTAWGADVKSVLQADEACEKLRGIAVSAIATQRHHQLQELLKSLNSQNLDFWRDYRHEQQQYYRSDRARACMTLLRAITYEDYKDRNPEPSDGTCRWFKTDTRFRNWLKEPGYSCLWVTADPGCGKSVLSKYLVDCYLGQQFGSDTTICYYFFKNEGTASCGTNAICSLLHQIFSNEPTKVLMHHIESDYQNNGDKLAGLFDRLWSVFQAVVKDNCAGRIVCVLDAFDECAPDDQRRLWKKFKSLAEKDRSLGSLKLLITSRPHIADAIEPELHESVKVLRLTGEAGEVSGGISREIENVIDQRLEDFRLKRQERGFKDSAHLQIRKSILKQGKNRTYLWVSFIFQDLFDHVGSPFPDLQAIFEQLPSTVEEQYEKILSTSKDRNLALKLLNLVIGAPKPMDPQHLYVRLLSTDTVSNIDHLEPPDTKPLHEYLRRLCGCFISITLHEDQQLSGDGSSKYKDRHDPEQYRVHLIHETAREFLVERHGNSAGEGLSFKWQWKGFVSGHDAYHKWAESCLFFIIMAHQVHMANADESNTEVVRELLKSPPLDVNIRNSGGRTALHLAALCLKRSILDILELLVDDSRVDINAQDETGMTALMLATRLISPVRITVLLQCRQLDVNIRTGEGDTALLMCLKTAADSLDWEKSPYQWVKWLESFLQCVQLLLAAPETDINIRNVDGEHAVFLAAMIPLPPLHQLLKRYGLDLSEPMQLQTLRPPQADIDVLKAAQDWLAQHPDLDFLKIESSQDAAELPYSTSDLPSISSEGREVESHDS
ncbi:hypothetical protein EDD36DRAFT_466815 [Exophiala viscosa]|uniref:NACHT domain-containing protein n=1 Tax=Exophiala viscosa TaxID=2486360 RepID=A0AAN6IAX7_9EURO|nr:hypothetical protein EDD36DRAFT_466815 [Exophiala viscosa]